jgi:spore maturation protein CgeB
VVVLYNNDDPFGPDSQLRMWRRFRRLVPVVDACASYRDINSEDYRRAGARNVFVLRSWFSPSVHRPIDLTDADRARFGADVTFVGHYEDDGRVRSIERLIRAGLHVRVFGAGWNLAGSAVRALLGPVDTVLGDDYSRAIRAAKIGLVFLSKRNRDQYTRRCFEIPAIGTLMLAPRTPELLKLYAEGTEAAYFGSDDEMVEQAIRHVRDDELRSRVAAAGRERCVRDGHDVDSRARQFMRDVDSLVPSLAGGVLRRA